MRHALAAVGAIALTLTPLGLLAQASPEQALQARQDYMKQLGANMAVLARMAQGRTAYDEAAAVQAATNLQTLSGTDVTGYFVPGTAEGEIGDSEALPAIWSDPQRFRAAFAGLGEAVAGAPQAVRGGQAQLGPVVQQIGGACKTCHDDFRAR